MVGLLMEIAVPPDIIDNTVELADTGYMEQEGCKCNK
jgi:hypothetical protein